MTGLWETEHVIEGLACGGIDYVVKPIVPEELLARIRVHLGNARLAYETRAALDASGRFLLATDRAGRVLWCTPKARALLSSAPPLSRDNYVLPRRVQLWLRHAPPRRPGGAAAWSPSAGGGWSARS